MLSTIEKQIQQFNNHLTMHIADEWLALEKEVLGQRPLITGSVDEVRAAYQETSEALAKLYPSPESYQVLDREFVRPIRFRFLDSLAG